MPTHSDPLAPFYSPLTDSQKAWAWHLLSLLLSNGHPVPPPELASLSTLFPSPPAVINHLSSSIPNSPITLTPNKTPHVTISGVKLEHFVRMYFRKRKRIRWFDSGEEAAFVPSKRICLGACFGEVQFQIPEDVRKILYGGRSQFPFKLNSIMATPNFFEKAISNRPSCTLTNIEEIEDEDISMVVESKEEKGVVVRELNQESALPSQVVKNDAVYLEAKVDEMDVRLSRELLLQYEGANNVCDCTSNWCARTTVEVCKEEVLVYSGKVEAEAEKFSQTTRSALVDTEPKSGGKRLNVPDLRTLAEMAITSLEDNQVISAKIMTNAARKQLSSKEILMDAKAPRRRALFQSLERTKPVNPAPKGKKNSEKDNPTISMPKELKRKHSKERQNDTASVCPNMEPKEFPLFESFVVEEEEGSGGYGTVFRARRKNDGTTVAIKCPHAKVHKNNVINELKMLERFGGKNFVIKYEGRLKSKNSDCFVLEHVKHDRPEILKKEIDVFQLQWYGYCLFRALATLHKQGIVHRDVKPGNFLFSRQTNKGYLIDFNLALDLHQKYGIPGKSKAENYVELNHATLPHSKSLPPAKSRRFLGEKSLDEVNREPPKSKNLKKDVYSTKTNNNVKVWNVLKSQGADGSGITSVKDVTSGRTPSAERLREPLPSQGRKELISLLQEARHSPNHQASSAPISLRKRIAAPPGKVDGRVLYPTPMPSNLNDNAFIRDGKHKKEGPCVGTKGFRAPEVLLRSLYQGPKVDVWSAGVTLLYLMTGRTPFFGDPEQNLKDIAKLRGSEDLWEVSKLHDRESAFPPELYTSQYLPSMSLMEWCKINTKRREFMDSIPSSLVDLVDKCLTVNPRLRISAEDALKHDFFSPCHESLRKHRLLRQRLRQDI